MNSTKCPLPTLHLRTPSYYWSIDQCTLLVAGTRDIHWLKRSDFRASVPLEWGYIGTSLKDNSLGDEEVMRLCSCSGLPLSRVMELGADFVRTDRGGLITFHGPGQLVAYPMLDLASLPSGRSGAIRWYVEKLETSLASLCRRHYGIRAGPVAGRTGVWVEERKIAAIGISVKQRRFTSHGIALNVATDMTWFSHIIPCGIEGAGVTSLSLEYGFSLDTAVVAPLFAAVFADVLGCEAELEGMPEMPIL